jgi:hypothetical protein
VSEFYVEDIFPVSFRPNPFVVGRAVGDFTVGQEVELQKKDAAWLGMTRFTLLRDRLDRVFACERFAVRSGNDADDLDLLYAELSERDVSTMPTLDAGLVRRSNLNGSPGWAYQQWRFLLASCVFGKIAELPWPQKSATKQKVAGQRNPEPPQPSLFEGLALDEIVGLEGMVQTDEDLDLPTLVVAHSLDPLSQKGELVIGRARLNAGGGQAWDWRHDLLSTPPTAGGRAVGNAPLPTGPDSVPDAPVRLRRPAAELRDGHASGER